MENLSIEKIINYSFISSIILILFVLASPIFLSLGVRYTPGGFQPPNGELVDIYSGKVVTQRFISGKDEFVGLGFSVKNPDLRNKKDLILDVTFGSEAREVRINGSVIGDGDLVKFIFTPEIKFSKNKEVVFSLSSPDSSEDEMYQIYLEDGNSRPNAILLDEDLGYPISFIDYYKVGNKFEYILQVYTKWLKKL